jgi:hypothetical protein
VCIAKDWHHQGRVAHPFDELLPLLVARQDADLLDALCNYANENNATRMFMEFLVIVGCCWLLLLLLLLLLFVIDNA